MSVDPASLTRGASVSPFAHFLELLRSFPTQARLALGVRGLMLASLAGLIDLACAVTFVGIALSLPAVDGLVLTLSILGFAGAGVVLILLVGRASMVHHEQWRKAREAQEILEETIDALPAGLVLYDQDERLVMHNTAAVASTPLLKERNAVGMTYEELAWETYRLREKFGTPLVDRPEDWIKRFRSKGVNTMRQSVQGRWFEWSEVATRSGRTVGLRIDVTEQRLRELELERSHGEYQQLVDALSDMVYKIDVATGAFTFVSAASADLLGVPPERLMGRKASDYVLAEDRARVMEQVAAHLKKPDGTIGHLRYRVRLADDRSKYVETRFRKVPDEGGRSIVAGVTRDIDDRVRLANRLRGEMARLHTIVGSSGAMILVTDRALRVTMVNSEFTAVTGIAEEQAVGRPLKEIVDCPLDPAVVQGWLADPLPPGRPEPVRFTNRLRDPAGRERVIAVTVTPSADEQGQVNGFVFLGVDDTDRRAAEAALFDTERLVTMGEMASTLAHEIAQPLQVINIAAAAMQDEIEDTRERGAMADPQFLANRAQRIVAQVERATRIIGEVRSFVRGTSQDVAAPFDVARAVRSAVDLTAHSAQQAGLHVSLSLPGGLPRVVGHAGRLEQVLVNLIGNARDAEARAVTIAAEQVDQEDRALVRIAVDDDGPGIPDDVLPRLFQTLITTKPRGLGTGLGLRICRRIVEEMGGTISAANRPQGGARFEILLPAAPARTASSGA